MADEPLRGADTASGSLSCPTLCHRAGSRWGHADASGADAFVVACGRARLTASGLAVACA